ncbi:hypothetical protein ABZZ01_34100, partial [Streptomyces virginiae]
MPPAVRVRVVALIAAGPLVGVIAPVGPALGALVSSTRARPLPRPGPPRRPRRPPRRLRPRTRSRTIACRPLHPDEPRSIAGYRLLGRIGAGGMGTVYLARREGAGTQVALKTIHPELLDHAELLLRFEREVEVLSTVSGAYTAGVLDAGVDAGRPYLAIPHLHGTGTVRRRARRHGRR